MDQSIHVTNMLNGERKKREREGESTQERRGKIERKDLPRAPRVLEENRFSYEE